MGSKYTSQSISGYNSSPPADDGSSTEANKVKWSTTKSKLTDPLKTLVEAVDTALATHVDLGPVSKSTAYTTTAAEHLKTIEVTGTTTITLGSAASMGAGYTVTVKNTDSNTVTITRSGSDTIDGGTGFTLDQYASATFQVDAASGDYHVIDYNQSTQYNVFVGSGEGSLTAIAPGASNTVLASNGTSANPSFKALTLTDTTIVPFTEQTVTSSTQATVRTVPIYIDPNTSTLEYAARMYATNGANAIMRIQIGATNGNELTETSATYDTTGGGSIDVSSFSGWSDLRIQLRNSDNSSNVYIDTISYYMT